MRAKRRVVVTGLGMVTPLGLDVATTWEALLAGRSGVSLIDEFDVSSFPCRFAASVKNFNLEDYLPSKEGRRMDRFIQYGMAAAIQAVTDADLTIGEHNADRVGVAIGSGIGGLSFIEKNHLALREDGPRKISPFFVPGVIVNMIAGQLSIHYGLQGPNLAIATACTTGTHNIGLGARSIAYDEADVMIVGGAEAATTPLGLAGFAACRALSSRNDDPQRASRPWDRDRDGFVLGDGAGVLVLEEYEHAKRRNAKIYAELLGFGMSADAHHITSPLPSGKSAMKAMLNAFKEAALSLDQLDYINAHATSTPSGDGLEVLAIKQAFVDHARKLAVSSTKSMTGHLLGAAGAVEAIFCVLALRDQVVPPTINLDHPSADCDLNFVPYHPQTRKLTYVLSNSFGFGGTNAVLLFGRLCANLGSS